MSNGEQRAGTQQTISPVDAFLSKLGPEGIQRIKQGGVRVLQEPAGSGVGLSEQRREEIKRLAATTAAVIAEATKRAAEAPEALGSAASAAGKSLAEERSRVEASVALAVPGVGDTGLAALARAFEAYAKVTDRALALAEKALDQKGGAATPQTPPAEAAPAASALTSVLEPTKAPYEPPALVEPVKEPRKIFGREADENEQALLDAGMSESTLVALITLQQEGLLSLTQEDLDNLKRIAGDVDKIEDLFEARLAGKEDRVKDVLKILSRQDLTNFPHLQIGEEAGRAAAAAATSEEPSEGLFHDVGDKLKELLQVVKDASTAKKLGGAIAVAALIGTIAAKVAESHAEHKAGQTAKTRGELIRAISQEIEDQFPMTEGVKRQWRSLTDSVAVALDKKSAPSQSSVGPATQPGIPAETPVSPAEVIASQDRLTNPNSVREGYYILGPNWEPYRASSKIGDRSNTFSTDGQRPREIPKSEAGNYRLLTPESLAGYIRSPRSSVPAEKTDEVVELMTGFVERVKKEKSRRVKDGDAANFFLAMLLAAKAGKMPQEAEIESFIKAQFPPLGRRARNALQRASKDYFGQLPNALISVGPARSEPTAVPPVVPEPAAVKPGLVYNESRRGPTQRDLLINPTQRANYLLPGYFIFDSRGQPFVVTDIIADREKLIIRPIEGNHMSISFDQLSEYTLRNVADEDPNHLYNYFQDFYRSPVPDHRERAAQELHSFMIDSQAGGNPVLTPYMASQLYLAILLPLMRRGSLPQGEERDRFIASAYKPFTEFNQTMKNEAVRLAQIHLTPEKLGSLLIPAIEGIESRREFGDLAKYAARIESDLDLNRRLGLRTETERRYVKWVISMLIINDRIRRRRVKYDDLDLPRTKGDEGYKNDEEVLKAIRGRFNIRRRKRDVRRWIQDCMRQEKAFSTKFRQELSVVEKVIGTEKLDSLRDAVEYIVGTGLLMKRRNDYDAAEKASEGESKKRKGIIIAYGLRYGGPILGSENVKFLEPLIKERKSILDRGAMRETQVASRTVDSARLEPQEKYLIAEEQLEDISVTGVIVGQRQVGSIRIRDNKLSIKYMGEDNFRPVAQTRKGPGGNYTIVSVLDMGAGTPTYAEVVNDVNGVFSTMPLTEFLKLKQVERPTRPNPSMLRPADFVVGPGDSLYRVTGKNGKKIAVESIDDSSITADIDPNSWGEFAPLLDSKGPTAELAGFFETVSPGNGLKHLGNMRAYIDDAATKYGKSHIDSAREFMEFFVEWLKGGEVKA